MSSAIKKFFEEQRLRSLRSKNKVKKQQEQQEVEQEQQETTLEQFEQELNDAVIEEEIIPPRVYVSPSMQGLRYRLVELTDEMMEQERLRQAIRDEEEYRRALDVFVPPPRPNGIIDRMYQSRIQQIKNMEIEFQNAINSNQSFGRTPGRYVPPSIRNQTPKDLPPFALRIKENIERTKTELDVLTYKLDKQNELWKEICKHDFYREYHEDKMSKMLEEDPNSN